MEPIETLTLVEQELLATLIETTEKLSALIERELPATLCADYSLLCKHSVSPWETLYYAYHDLVRGEDKKKLFLRAVLEAISHELHDTAHEMTDSQTTDLLTDKGDTPNG